MPAGPHAIGHTGHSRVGTWQPEKNQVKVITSIPQIGEPRARTTGSPAVVSKAKLSRFWASSRKRTNMTRPAASATRSGSNAESPRAITSAVDEFGHPERIPQHLRS